MIKLEAHEMCPHGDSCGHKDDFVELGFMGCQGTNPDRDRVFVCEFFTKGHKSGESECGSEIHPQSLP